MKKCLLRLNAIFAMTLSFACSSSAQRQMEHLSRGLAAVHQGEGKVFVSWRLLGTEPDEIAFNVYRSGGGAGVVKLNKDPIRNSTCIQDDNAKLDQPTSYLVRAVLKGKEQEAGGPFQFTANAPARPYLSVPLQLRCCGPSILGKTSARAGQAARLTDIRPRAQRPGILYHL